MYSATPPISNLSRPKLKRLAAWIRDDLDPLVAREGPDVLRPDDVLTLHEAFVTLRHAGDITALDLRATGIHRAVQDIAGIATRWPSRLCDDCDKIITTWTIKYGSLKNIHPFLYGRGGRLEGVASKYEYSREALLKRWTLICPNKIHPKRSHRLGSLRFRAGAWWINPLFAHHAGIIGLESIEGGTTYDKHGAYALLLKDTGEVEANSMERFTYRCLKSDKGKFRLTSATPRSREPIRVLRSHSVNSVQGPKAGVRYEGLYRVQGWSIRAAKSTDFVSGEWKEGDIIFEIKFERTDAVDMQEVIRYPTAAEVDDYSEYKRIRKATRDGKRKEHAILTNEMHHEPVPVVPAPLQPINPPKNQTLEAMHRTSSRQILLQTPHFDKDSILPTTPGIDVVSPMTIPDIDHFGFATTTASKKGTLEVPAQPNTQDSQKTDSSPSDPISSLSPETSVTGSGSGRTAGTQPHIREVAPWIDYDAELALPVPDPHINIARERITSQAQTPVASASAIAAVQEAKHSSKSKRPKAHRRTHHDSGDNNARTSTDFNRVTLQLSPTTSRKHEPRKSVLARSHNPIAKLFDGTKSSERDQEPEDYFGDAVPPSHTRLSTVDGDALQRSPHREHDCGSSHKRASSISIAEGSTSPRIHSPVPTRPFGSDTAPLSPISLLRMARRDGICPPPASTAPFPILPKVETSAVANSRHNNGSAESESESPGVPWPVARALPVALKWLIGRGSRGMSESSPRVGGESEGLDGSEGSGDMEGNTELGKQVGEVRALDVKVKFRDPFRGERTAKRGRRRSSDVAPDSVG